MVANSVLCMNSPLGGVKPSWDQLCVCVDHPYPLPLSHDYCMVRTAPPPIFSDILAKLN
jgi:hypothetical protein